MQTLTEMKRTLINREKEGQEALQNTANSLRESYEKKLQEKGYAKNWVAYAVILQKINTPYENELYIALQSIQNAFEKEKKSLIEKIDALTLSIRNQSIISPIQRNRYERELSDLQTKQSAFLEEIHKAWENFSKEQESKLEEHIRTLSNTIETQKELFQKIDTFIEQFNTWHILHEEFKKNFSKFEEIYLSQAGALSEFIKTKQKEYSTLLKEDLLKVKAKNLEVHPSLQEYTKEFDRLIDILMENFENSLSRHMQESFVYLLYESKSIKTLSEMCDIWQNKYFNEEGIIKAELFQRETLQKSLEEIEKCYKEIEKVNNTIKELIQTNENETKETLLENIKIEIENIIIRFYNRYYVEYRKDLLEKLKEKLSLHQLKMKNILLAGDAMDIRYKIAYEAMKNQTNIQKLQNEFENFKKEIHKYSLLNSDILNKKSQKLLSELESMIILTELKQAYPQRLKSFSKHEKTIVTFFETLKKNHSKDVYQSKIEELLKKINESLNTQTKNTKNYALYLYIKYHVLKEISNL